MTIEKMENEEQCEKKGIAAGEDESLYSGRWTHDEEQYAQGLMQEFRAGNIPDLENGATLRNYIAQMLSCPPKRITKKYERTAYNGKLTYCSNVVAMTDDEARRRQSRLKDLREKFLASRKQRLMGKPYQKPRPKADTTARLGRVFRAAEGKEDPDDPFSMAQRALVGRIGLPSRAVRATSDIMMSESALRAALLGRTASRNLASPALASLNPLQTPTSSSLLEATAAARAATGALPFASLAESSLLGRPTLTSPTLGSTVTSTLLGQPSLASATLSAGLHDHLLLNSGSRNIAATLDESSILRNPLLQQRSALLGQGLGGGALLPTIGNPLRSQELAARQQLIDSIRLEETARLENERAAALIAASGVSVRGQIPGVPHAAAEALHEADLATQILNRTHIARRKRSREEDEPPSPPGKRNREP